MVVIISGLVSVRLVFGFTVFVSSLGSRSLSRGFFRADFRANGRNKKATQARVAQIQILVLQKGMWSAGWAPNQAWFWLDWVEKPSPAWYVYRLKLLRV